MSSSRTFILGRLLCARSSAPVLFWIFPGQFQDSFRNINCKKCNLREFNGTLREIRATRQLQWSRWAQKICSAIIPGTARRRISAMTTVSNASDPSLYWHGSNASLCYLHVFHTKSTTKTRSRQGPRIDLGPFLDPQGTPRRLQKRRGRAPYRPQETPRHPRRPRLAGNPQANPTGPTSGPHLRVPPPGPTSRSHVWVPPPGPTSGSHLGAHLRVPPPGPTCRATRSSPAGGPAGGFSLVPAGLPRWSPAGE